MSSVYSTLLPVAFSNSGTVCLSMYRGQFDIRSVLPPPGPPAAAGVPAAGAPSLPPPQAARKLLPSASPPAPSAVRARKPRRLMAWRRNSWSWSSRGSESRGLMAALLSVGKTVAWHRRGPFDGGPHVGFKHDLVAGRRQHPGGVQIPAGPQRQAGLESGKRLLGTDVGHHVGPVGGAQG